MRVTTHRARLGIVMSSLLTLACGAIPPKPDAGVRTIEGVAYLAEAGPRQVADLWLPPAADNAPVILLIHGGGWIRGEREDVEKFAIRLANAGYVVMNTGYRLAPEHRHPAQINDVREAARWLHANAERYGGDPANMAVFGYSAGAHLALLLGLTEPGLPIRAVVAGAAPTDLRVYTDSPYVTRYIGGGPDEFPHQYADASPVTHVDRGDPPVFLYHGSADRLVTVEHSRWMHTALAEAGVPHRYREIPYAGHATAYLFDADTMRSIFDFLDIHLADAAGT